MLNIAAISQIKNFLKLSADRFNGIVQPEKRGVKTGVNYTYSTSYPICFLGNFKVALLF